MKASFQDESKMPKELSYLDIGEIEDENGNTVLSLPTATPNDEFGERVCKAFNCFDEFVAALKAARGVIDEKRAPLTFNRLNDALAKVGGAQGNAS
jgi:hypothetical protein